MEIIDEAVNVHTHTQYSLMDSTNKPKELVAKVKAMGQASICITDHGETSGLIEVYNECKKQGIHMVFGCEHYLVPDVLIKEGGYKHIIFWAKNNIGYNNLLKLTTEAHQNFYRKPRVDIDMIRKYSEGLAMSTACIGGWLRIKDEYGNNTVDIDLLEQFIEIFPNDLWIELHTYSINEQKWWNRILIDIAEKYNLPLITACDAHYTNKEDAYAHKMWITQGKEREDGYYQHPEFFLHSGQEIREALSYLPSDIVEEAIANTKVLADSCQVEIKFGEQHYPKVESENSKESVRQIMLKNWRSKVPRSEWKDHEARVNHEMPILEKADYFPYFLIMHDFMEHCQSHGIPVYPDSRGSAGGCDVAYIMDIHKTNPIKYDLMFARFLHEARITPCDIDIDVSQKKRGEAIEYIKNKYGHDRVFQARTYGYMSAKGALKRAGRSLGYDPQYINDLSKGISKFGDDEFKGEAKDRHLLDQLDAPKDLIELAKSFVGILQSYSVHASGVIVFPDDPNNYCAIEKSGDNYVTAYEFHTLEKLGILKLDILGIKTIDVIYDTLKLIDNPPDIINLPPADTKTFDMLCKGKTAGVFQIEGRGFTQLVQAIQPRTFEDLAPLMAVYRPAIISAGLLQTYIDRRTGKEQVEYLHPDLEPLLGQVYGLMIYQENIIEVAKTICGYSAGEADMIRRACGRKLPEEMAKIKPDFIQHGISKGYDITFIERLWELIEFFAEYGFGKAHTYGYGTRAYITAYLKANHTKEFMVSLINSEDNQEDTIPYIEECKSLGIPILPPDLSVCNTQWIIEGDSIRIGLHYLKGVGNNLCTDYTETLNDIIAHNHKNTIESLIKSGALDYLGHTRAYMLTNLSSLQDTMKRVKQCQQKIRDNQELLQSSTLDKDKRKYERQINSWTQKLNEAQAHTELTEESYDEVKGECEVLGFSFKEIPKVKLGKLTNIFKKNDKNSHEMAWLTMDSDYGEYRCTVFASGWKLIADKVIVGESYKFIVGDTNILEELKVNGEVIKLNERKFWKR
jgi:DNA polymerase-3 subunit alpha